MSATSQGSHGAAAFVGSNYSYYLSNWQKYRSNRAYKGWNWAACFFRVEWLAYRKMYLEAVLLLGVTSLISFFLGWRLTTAGADLQTANGAARLFRLMVQLLFGAFGNYLYFRKAAKAVREAQLEPETEQLFFLQNRGGTSVAAVIVLILLEMTLLLR